MLLSRCVQRLRLDSSYMFTYLFCLVVNNVKWQCLSSKKMTMIDSTNQSHMNREIELNSSSLLDLFTFSVDGCNSSDNQLPIPLCQLFYFHCSIFILCFLSKAYIHQGLVVILKTVHHAKE